ncbi:MAG: hypothetical protein AAF560_14170 [Acidobacteriota bacterium]
MKHKLEIAVNLSIIALCLTAVATFAKVHFFSSPTPLEPVAQGDVLEPVRDLVAEQEESALLVALSPTCGYCTDSFPFLGRLAAERTARGAPVRLVAVVNSEEEMSRERELLNASGVELDDVVAVDFLSLRVPGTPTILHVDDRGEVLNVWLGLLDEEGEREVLQVLATRA